MVSPYETSDFPPKPGLEPMEIEALRADTGDLHIVSPQLLDSRGLTTWKNYLLGNDLLHAWLSTINSRYYPYGKTRTLNAAPHVADRLQPRYSLHEEFSEKQIEAMVAAEKLNRHTAVILDLGGAHSVAMAAKLSDIIGAQPVVMFDALPLSNGSVNEEQSLAALTYYAGHMYSANVRRDYDREAPPVFVLNTHRSDKPKGNQIDTSYALDASDFPSSRDLLDVDITHAVYIREGHDGWSIRNVSTANELASMPSDMRQTLQEWLSGGIKLSLANASINPEANSNARHMSASLAHGMRSMTDGFGEGSTKSSVDSAAVSLYGLQRIERRKGDDHVMPIRGMTIAHNSLENIPEVPNPYVGILRDMYRFDARSEDH